MKNKFLISAMIIASVGLFLEPKLVGVGILVALTGLFLKETK